jgi:hypothetical protein
VSVYALIEKENIRNNTATKQKTENHQTPQTLYSDKPQNLMFTKKNVLVVGASRGIVA